MKRLILALAFLSMVILPSTSFSTIIELNLLFGDSTTWSGSASFNDQIYQPFVGNPAFTAYAFETFTLTYNQSRTWDIGNLTPVSFPPYGGVIRDNFGHLGLILDTISLDQSLLSINLVTSALDGSIRSSILEYSGDARLSTDIRVTPVFVPSPVPEPSTIILLGVGLGGLFVVRRRKK